ncbi:hypothetical protein E2542_SST05163 [Spatholobus suberectus]|nr:hypothetical protein E2542_SST05163 [Spatholobus suberectus]
MATNPVSNINGYQEICGNRSESQVHEQSWNSRRSLIRNYSSNNERPERILEIDFGKPHFTLEHINLSYFTGSDHYRPRQLYKIPKWDSSTIARASST